MCELLTRGRDERQAARASVRAAPSPPGVNNAEQETGMAVWGTHR